MSTQLTPEQRKQRIETALKVVGVGVLGGSQSGSLLGTDLLRVNRPLCGLVVGIVSENLQ